MPHTPDEALASAGLPSTIAADDTSLSGVHKHFLLVHPVLFGCFARGKNVGHRGLLMLVCGSKILDSRSNNDPLVQKLLSALNDDRRV
jgi:hypothetical protein